MNPRDISPSEVGHNDQDDGNNKIKIDMNNPPKRIIPPLNFCPVEHQLYRSGQPTSINQNFLHELHLKTLIWLATEEPQEEFLEYCQNNDINLEFVGMMNDYSYNYSNLNPWDTLNEVTITKSLEIMANKENYPILVCCGMGRHRTGTVIGCLRRLQNWNLASVSEEYRRFTGAKGGRIQVELLIESFNINSIDIDPDLAPNFLK